MIKTLSALGIDILSNLIKKFLKNISIGNILFNGTKQYTSS